MSEQNQYIAIISLIVLLLLLPLLQHMNIYADIERKDDINKIEEVSDIEDEFTDQQNNKKQSDDESDVAADDALSKGDSKQQTTEKKAQTTKQLEKNKTSSSKENDRSQDEQTSQQQDNNQLKEQTNSLHESEKKDGKDKSIQRTITPFAGNLNIDIDLSPKKKNVHAGNDAAYNLVVKVTGAMTTYHNAKIIVDLPDHEHAKFTQDLSELEIDGVQPIYDEAENQLIYEFAKLRSGQTYESLIKVNTDNGPIPNGTELIARASFIADEQEEITDDASLTIKAAKALSVSKRFKEARSGGQPLFGPRPGSFTYWDIKVDIPKETVGQMFLKEGSKIIIKDTFSSGLNDFNLISSSPTLNNPVISGRTVTWELDAPTIVEQAEAEGELYTLEFQVRLHVNNNTNLIGTSQENNVEVTATFIDDESMTESSKDTITIISSEQADGEIDGTVVYTQHIGPRDSNGNVGGGDYGLDPNPEVYDDAYLQFRHGIHSLRPGKKYDYDEFRTEYTIDPNLVFEKIKTPGNWVFGRNNAEARLNIPLAKEPEYNIVARVNGTFKTLVTNAAHNTVYTRADLGLSESDNVSEIRLNFTHAPAGMNSRPGGLVEYYFTVKQGASGRLSNHFNVRAKPNQRAIDEQNDFEVDANGIYWYKFHDENSWNNLASERHVTIIPRPTDQPPVATVAVELLDHDNGEVVHGENRMKVTLANRNSSTLAIRGPLNSVVLLPPGVTLKSEPNAQYTDSSGLVVTGNYEILNDNYEGTGRQLVKISWDERFARIGKDVTAELDVNIANYAPNTLPFDVYGFSGEPELKVPSTSGDSMTETILQTDDEDLNDNGITDEPRLKSANRYIIRGNYNIQTVKLIKGELDSEFTHFGKTIPGGAIDYQITLTNTTGHDISTMTLMDVLPSEGDLGITDHINRGSQFTPTLTGPIAVPTEWADKVKIVYSTAKNPKRDDLTVNTIYPDTTTKLSNPAGAVEPNWQPASAIADWSTIHSFKIELKEGVEWISGQDIVIEFAMQAPEVHEVDREILDDSVEAQARAAWNSFAIATDHGQPVEPLRVGVYMDFDMEDPEPEKTVNDKPDVDELDVLDELIVWKVDYPFGNYPYDWESVVIQDTINDLLDIREVTVVDEDGVDVTDKGILNISDNVVTFTLNKQDGSFTYLTDKTYTLTIHTTFKNDLTYEDLAPYLETGVPNEAQLIIDDDPTVSNEVTIIPPVMSNLKVIKIDSETADRLDGAEFSLYKCLLEQDDISNCEFIDAGTTMDNGEITFTNLYVGTYKLVETKAPEGYRLLTKPVSVEITADDEGLVEITIENSEQRWELPKTGGIGTFIFYASGVFIMVSALYMLVIRGRKTN